MTTVEERPPSERPPTDPEAYEPPNFAAEWLRSGEGPTGPGALVGDLAGPIVSGVARSVPRFGGAYPMAPCGASADAACLTPFVCDVPEHRVVSAERVEESLIPPAPFRGTQAPFPWFDPLTDELPEREEFPRRTDPALDGRSDIPADEWFGVDEGPDRAA